MAQHPLEPLDESEFRQVAAALRRDQSLSPSWRFASIELVEPTEGGGEGLDAGRPGASYGASRCCGTATTTRRGRASSTWTDDTVVSWTHVPGVTPHFTVDEYHEVDEAMRAHPDVIAALADRGITDLSLVTIEVWTYGKALMPEQWRDRRLGWCDIWYRETPEGNLYAHPVSGLKLVVDVNSLELLEIENDHDHGQPDVDGEYVPGPWTGERATTSSRCTSPSPRGSPSPSRAPS